MDTGVDRGVKVSEIESFIPHIIHIIQVETGLSIILVIILSIVGILTIALVFDSSQGRGRRYRRGYRVAYTEQLGKERAKIRAEQERKGEKKSGVRERKWRR